MPTGTLELSAALSLQAAEEISRRKSEPAWMLEFRRDAWKQYERIPMPTRKDEEWRRTDLGVIRWDLIRPYEEPGAAGRNLPPSDGVAREPAWASGGLVAPELRDRALLREDEGGKLLQWNSETIWRTLRPEFEAKGVILCGLDEAIRKYPDRVRPHLMTECVPVDWTKFTALHAAMMSGGTFLYVPPGVQVEVPIHAVFWCDAERLGMFPHTLIIVEEGAEVTYLEERDSPGRTDQGFACTCAEILCRKGSRARFVTLENWGPNVFNLAAERAITGERTSMRWITGEIGSRLTKAKIQCDIAGAESDCEMLGMYFLDGRQHSDIITLLEHSAPHTRGNVLFKGACKDFSRTVFRGCIHVGKQAGQTESFLRDDTMLLSDTAKSDSVPTLEIEARDVMCKHAATVGQPDEDVLFYLMSRGLPRDEAVKTLVFGFFEQVMSRVPVAGVQRRLLEAVERKFYSEGSGGR